LHNATTWRSRDPRHRFLDSRSSLFVGRHSPIRFVVLEAAIREAALALNLLPASRTDVWPHPISDDEARSPSHPLQPEKLSIAFLGAAKRSKGFDKFLDIMRVALRHDPRGYKFSLIGAIYDRFAAVDLVGIELSDDMLPRSEYLDRLRRVDYVCMPLEPDTYALTASASLLDCVASATPLIATRTAAVAHMAVAGPIGFLADSPDALADIVLDRARLADRATYEMFQRNLVCQQRQRLPGAIASAVRETLSQTESPLG
jgi:glycosyltransferase involved in cell wall biosynthesis